MKNNEGKCFSISLGAIIGILLVVGGIIFSINTISKNIKVAKQEKQEDTQITVATTEKQNAADTEVTSRAMTESREKLLEELENNNDTKVEEITSQDGQDNNSEIKAEEELQSENIEEPEVVYTKIEDVTISQGMDLTIRTGLSREDFINLMAGVKADKSGFFEENAGLIYDLCEKYEINEIFFCGLISAESGWDIASNHRRTYNYISLMSNGKLLQFSSVENGLEEAAKSLHNKYLTPGGRFYHGKTLSGVKKCFCPSSSTWVNLVYGRMKQII